MRLLPRQRELPSNPPPPGAPGPFSLSDPDSLVTLLQGAPTYGLDIARELTTPTGAALLAANAEVLLLPKQTGTGVTVAALAGAGRTRGWCGGAGGLRPEWGEGGEDAEGCEERDRKSVV